MSIAALLSYAPQLRNHVPCLPLGDFPTPVLALALEAELGRSVWVKADDRSSPLYGGNKVRKLEVALARAREGGASTVLTAGALGSHHVLATALYGRQVGLKVNALLYPQTPTPHVISVCRAIYGLCQSVTFTPSYRQLPRWAAAAWWKSVDFGLSLPPDIIPPGGSDVWGTLGYVGAALELAAQVERGEMPPPRWIVVPLGSGGTVAGLLLGLGLTSLTTRVMAVRVAPAVVANEITLTRQVTATAQFLRQRGLYIPPARWGLDLLQIDGDELGATYGDVTPSALNAVQRGPGLGLHLDTTYTGKAFASLLRQAHHLEGPLLFWNTLSSADTSPLDVTWPDNSHLPPEVRALVETMA